MLVRAHRSLLGSRLHAVQAMQVEGARGMAHEWLGSPALALCSAREEMRAGTAGFFSINAGICSYMALERAMHLRSHQKCALSLVHPCHPLPHQVHGRLQAMLTHTAAHSYKCALSPMHPCHSHIHSPQGVRLDGCRRC